MYQCTIYSKFIKYEELYTIVSTPLNESTVTTASGSYEISKGVQKPNIIIIKDSYGTSDLNFRSVNEICEPMIAETSRVAYFMKLR